MNARQNPIATPSRSVSRRTFLRGASAGAAALLLPTILPARVVRGANLPSNRITVGQIGLGERGSSVNQDFMSVPNIQFVAICDLFPDRRAGHVARANAAYGANSCKGYQDFRELVARPDIDAVVVTTPDNWHVLAALHAVRAGKDVYVEKPLSTSVEQNQALRAACRRHNRLFQYGTQQRSMGHVRHGCELVRNGRIGKLQSVEVIAPADPAQAGGGSMTPIPIPAGFDYEMWLGASPWSPYTKDRCTYQGAWFCYDNSIGFLGGWGAHPLDVMVWGLGDTPDAVPIEYEGTGSFPTEGIFDAINMWDVHGRFANGASFHMGCKPYNLTTFIGDKGKVMISRGGLQTEPASLAREVIGPGEIHLIASNNHQGNFIESVRTRQQTISPVEVACLSDAVSHMCDIAIRTGRKIKWDPWKEEIIGDEDAARRLTRPLRGPWTL
jgi:glucose-fructose oxidoreductase